MKIGILTYHKSFNNGSFLQAYALSNVVSNMGYDVEIVDYIPQKFNEIYSLFSPNSMGFLKKLIYYIKKILVADIYLSTKRNFLGLQNKCLNLSKEKYFYDSNFEQLNKEYDVLIVGSDQIWNLICSDCDDIYFLPIKHLNKKVSYAPSLNDIKKLPEKYIDLISDFDSVSVREQSGKATLNDCLLKDVFVAIDPTLLIDIQYYEKFDLKDIVKKDYIFLYTIKYSEDVISVSKALSEKYNLCVYTMINDIRVHYVLEMKKNKIRYRKSCNDPVAFLRYIKNASYVVTDSFHGTAFSVIFEKEFWAVNIKKDGKYYDDERISTLLEKLNLKDRFITADNQNFNNKIDYDTVGKLKKEYVEESLDWLKNAIIGDNNE